MSNKLVLILIGVMFVLILGMGGGMFMMWSKLSVISAHTVVPETDKNAEKAKPEQAGKVVALDTFIVNLADEGGQRYLRISMQLELSDKELEKEVEKRLPKIRHSIHMILPSKKSEDIRTSEGKTKVRDELIAAINESLATGTVKGLYFTEFVIQ
jgi:flagellar FliL protein